MNFPFLSVITLTPVVMAVILLMMPEERKNEIRVAALAGATLCLTLSLWVYFNYQLPGGDIPQYQFVEKFPWLPQLGISYHMGVDGVSNPLVLLTGIVIFTGVLISWGIDDRPREFFAFLFILATGVFGVFVSLDLFQLFFFYEIAVFPMYLLIAIWGWKVTREYAAMKLTLFLFIGSVFSLIGALAVYFTILQKTGVHTFDMLEIARLQQQGALDVSINLFGAAIPFENLWFPIVFFGFAVLGGIFPFHNWSPDGHVAAPTAVSMFHAGVLMKLGAFAALRVGIQLMPEGAKVHLWWIFLLTFINVIYGAFIAMRQTDLKYMIGYSSVSHMGLVTMGFATLNYHGYLGGGMQMFAHGVMTAMLFATVGMIYDRAHTRMMPELGGMAKKMPWVMIGFTIAALSSMGMPGFAGFMAEFPIFMGSWQISMQATTPEALRPIYPYLTMISALAIVVTAAYLLICVQKVFFGEISEEHDHHVGDVRAVDKVAITVLATSMIAIGIFPALMGPQVQSGINAVLNTLGIGGA
ncbi:MAG TPA: NADH-quinone oxidoreductase subunit M [Anaerolineales bacterium]|nr:NADH-quinone oxidoreductase subunit M [Anaerolineales bacterium]